MSNHSFSNNDGVVLSPIHHEYDFGELDAEGWNLAGTVLVNSQEFHVWVRDVEKNELFEEVERYRADQRRHDAALRTLTGMGYFWNGGEYYHAPKVQEFIK